MAAPVRFETLDRQMKLAPGTVAAWAAAPGFPLAGVGVALLDAVIEWRRSVDGTGSPVQSPVAAEQPVQLPAVEVEPPAGDDIEYITIRIPIKRGGDVLSGAHPIPTFRISHKERHLREAFSAVFYGCRDSHKQLRSGQHVDKRGHSLKYILEAVAAAMGK